MGWFRALATCPSSALREGHVLPSHRVGQLWRVGVPHVGTNDPSPWHWQCSYCNEDIGEGRFHAGLDLSLCEEVRGVLLHQSVQRGLFREVALVVNRCAIWRPLGLPADCVQARLSKWGAHSVSGRPQRLTCPEFSSRICALWCWATVGGRGNFSTDRFGTPSSLRRMFLMGRAAAPGRMNSTSRSRHQK
jgi:hypothetical protein